MTKHPVVWFEVIGNDGDALCDFYRSLFGWKIDADNPMKYGTVDTSGAEKGIPGGVGQTKAPEQPRVTFYVETPDLADTLAKAGKLGAKTVLPPTAIGDGTKIALFADPQGHIIGLVAA
jgi:predicted enzyme related to lactoylglutathione lyase